MKRIILLFLATGTIISALLLTGQAMKKEPVSVDVWTVQPVTASDTLMCSGTVERAGEKKIYASENGVVTQLLVKNGDHVEKGQTIAVLKALPQTSENSALQTYEQLWEEYQQTGVIPTGVDLTAITDSTSKEETQESSQAGEEISINSTTEGTVSGLSAEEGETVTAGSTLAVVAQDDSLRAVLYVNESLASQVEVGQRAEIAGVGFPDITFEGEILSISDEAVQQASTTGKETVVEVVLQVLNPTDDIKPGYTIKAAITTKEIPDTALIPYTAVLADEDGQEYVYVVEDGKAVRKNITAETEFAQGLTISAPFAAGTKLILEPEQVQEGSWIQGREKEAFPDA